MSADFDLDQLGVFRLGNLGGRLAAGRACRLVRWQLDLFFDHRQVRVVASSRTRRARLMATRPPKGFLQIVQAIRSVLGTFLF